jgi:ABC transporter substrate binding protein (PQQ-dependent alcohol dehydrogenase system)
MAADALAQVLIAKRWREWFLVTGPRPADALFADAMRRAAHRFGAEIVAEKTWTGDHDLRRSAPAEVAQFTQGPDYDVLVVADEAGDFGDYLPYNTDLPRPVAGTQGLVPTAWHWSLELWGAGQLQSRFEKLAGRRMGAGDYTAWLAARIIGEAATRTNATDAATLTATITGPEMDVAAFKGRPLTFRAWNGQLRQPIPLVWPRSLVTLAPQEGFLHPVSDLDTLGWDEPESRCKESIR